MSTSTSRNSPNIHMCLLLLSKKVHFTCGSSCVQVAVHTSLLPCCVSLSDICVISLLFQPSSSCRRTEDRTLSSAMLSSRVRTLHFLIDFMEEKLTAIKTCFFSVTRCSCRVSVQPSRGGKGQRDAVHSARLAPELPGPAPRGERREEGHGEAPVSGDTGSVYTLQTHQFSGCWWEF